MNTIQIDCGKCKTPQKLLLTAPTISAVCSSCKTPITVEAFPALLKETAPGQKGETLIIDDESSCFYHPTKKAAVVCEGCGRFLCALCDIDFKGKHLCSTCIETGARKEQNVEMRKDITYYDEIAVTVALAPLFIFYVTLITAPIALYIAIRYWNTPVSVVPRSRWRFVVAIIFALAEIGGWAAFFIIIFWK